MLLSRVESSSFLGLFALSGGTQSCLSKAYLQKGHVCRRQNLREGSVGPDNWGGVRWKPSWRSQIEQNCCPRAPTTPCSSTAPSLPGSVLCWVEGAKTNRGSINFVHSVIHWLLYKRTEGDQFITGRRVWEPVLTPRGCSRGRRRGRATRAPPGCTTCWGPPAPSTSSGPGTPACPRGLRGRS